MNSHIWGGNLAKVRVYNELEAIVQSSNGKVKVLDVGCVGSSPLQFWEDIFSRLGSEQIDLTGVDLDGIDIARRIAEQKNWDVNLRSVSGYELSQYYPPQFDLVLSVQVLEHVRYPKKFLSEVHKVTRPDGICLLTMDSRHFPRKQSLKKIVKNFIGRYIKERYYDIGLYDSDVEEICEEIGFAVLDKSFYNIHPLKQIHNHEIDDCFKNLFLNQWFVLEEMLNNDEPFIKANKQYFLGIFFKLQKKVI